MWEEMRVDVVILVRREQGKNQVTELGEGW